MSELIDKNPTPSSTNVAASSVEAPSYTQKLSFGQLLRGDLGFLPVLLTFLVIAIYFELTHWWSLSHTRQFVEFAASNYIDWRRLISGDICITPR